MEQHEREELRKLMSSWREGVLHEKPQRTSLDYFSIFLDVLLGIIRFCIIGWTFWAGVSNDSVALVSCGTIYSCFNSDDIERFFRLEFR